MIQLRRSTALATKSLHDRVSPIAPSTIINVRGFLTDTYEIWVADYELGYENGFAAARAGKPYNTVGVKDEPGRSADAYKNGYGKGYPAGQYQKAKDNSDPLPPLNTIDPKIDPAKPEIPPPPPLPSELKLPPADPTPKPGDQPPPPQTNNFGVMMVILTVVFLGGAIYFVSKVA